MSDFSPRSDPIAREPGEPSRLKLTPKDNVGIAAKQGGGDGFRFTEQ
jgi:hypothetical protein